MSHRQYMTDPLFIKACELAGVPVTKRQASKWRAGRGIALAHKGKAQSALKQAEQQG